MTLTEVLVALCLSLALLAMVLWVAVGQITLRRLRKHPETKEVLGTEFASGWDVLNVAGALSRPKCFFRHAAQFAAETLGGGREASLREHQPI